MGIAKSGGNKFNSIPSYQCPPYQGFPRSPPQKQAILRFFSIFLIPDNVCLHVNYTSKQFDPL